MSDAVSDAIISHTLIKALCKSRFSPYFDFASASGRAVLGLLVPVCAGDVLELGACDKTADEWRYVKYRSSYRNFRGLVLGDLEFMACWDTKNNKPLYKKPFNVGRYLSVECSWDKVGLRV